MSIQPADFQRIFEAIPAFYTVVDTEWRIVAMTDASLKAVGRRREEVLNQLIYEAFPDNPHDEGANGTSVLRSALERAVAERTGHTLSVQRYDIQNADGIWEERYWRPVNEPVLNDEGGVEFVIHGVDDVTNSLISH